ncbi:MAG: SBBP repeat-containing protein [Euryarchaeota archaeon]|nr:SBBP repeat-containing protein [Euryarchaeota archaeon]
MAQDTGSWKYWLRTIRNPKVIATFLVVILVVPGGLILPTPQTDESASWTLPSTVPPTATGEPLLSITGTAALDGASGRPAPKVTAPTAPPIPIHIEENRGQFDANVLYAARSSDSMLAFETDAVTWVSGRSAMRMEFPGSRPHTTPTGVGPVEGVSSYFRGSDESEWVSGARHFSSVSYGDLYPGIDLIFYPPGGTALEYDFMVHPGADPSLIKMAFTGATVELAATGDLLLHGTDGDILRHAPPSLYQTGAMGEHQDVAGRFEKSWDGTIGFSVAPYDAARDLVIDPRLEYATYLGGQGFEYAHSLFVDSSGNVYVVGSTTSDDSFPTTPNALRRTRNKASNEQWPKTDVFVAKLNPSGTSIVYATYVGGSDQEYAHGITVDTGGNAYLAGYTTSDDFPVTANALQSSRSKPASESSCCPGSDAFLMKINPTGTNLAYSTYLGGKGGEYASALVVASNGAAYITGSTSSDDFPVSSNAFQRTRAKSSTENSYYPPADVFVAQVNPGGTALTFSTLLGGVDSEYPHAMSVDSSGNVYVQGSTTSSDFPVTSNAFQRTLTRNSNSYYSADVFAAKFNSLGTSLTYSTFIGGDGYDYPSAAFVDSVGNTYLSGSTSSDNFPTTAGAFQTTRSKASSENACCLVQDAFVTKLNSAGTALTFSTFLGGKGHDYAGKMSVDANGNIYIAGTTTSDDFPVTANAFQRARAKNTTESYPTGDAFVTKVSSTGTSLIYSTYLGGNKTEYANGLFVDSTGTAYVTGQTGSDNFPTTARTLQSARGRTPTDSPDWPSQDSFVTVMNATGTGLSFSTFLGGNQSDYATGLSVDSSGNIYVLGSTSSEDFPVTSNAFQQTLVKDASSTYYYYSGGDVFITKITMAPACTGPPVTSANATGTAGSNGWNTSAVNLTFSVASNCTIVSHFQVDGGAVQSGANATLSSDGDHNVTYYATDEVGNNETARTIRVKVDRTTTLPSINLTCLDQPLVTTCRSANFTSVISATDATSGVLSLVCKDNGTTINCASADITGAGLHNITANLTDNAGNTRNSSANLTIDTTLGVISSLSFTRSPTSEKTGVTISDVVVKAKDAYGNVADTFTGIITVALGVPAGKTATLSGTATASAVRGVATFSGLTITGDASNSYTFIANATLPNATGTNVTSGTFALTAPPTVSLIYPPFLNTGTTGTTLTVKGANFTSGTTVNVSGGNVSVTAVTVSSSTQLTITVSVDQNARSGPRTVTAGNAAGDGLCYGCITVRAVGDNVRTWGNAGNGRLGDGSIAGTVTSPVTATGLANAVEVGGQDFTSHALLSNGTVWGWGGQGSDGRVGDGNTNTNQATPVEVRTDATTYLSGVVQIAVGGGHTQALKSDGTVFGWGYNADGRLGDGTTSGRAYATQATGLSNAVRIAVGDSHSLAVDSNGDIWAWGGNSRGQFGNGTTTDSTSPTRLSTFSGAVQLSAGRYHSLALMPNGTVYSWGANDYGQLGDGTTTDRSTPAKVAGISQIVQVAGGAYSSYALAANGTIYAWGRNDDGRLGDGSTTQRTSPVALTALSNATLLGGGIWEIRHSLVLAGDGNAYASGSNSNGQLAVPTSTTSRSSHTVVTGLLNVTAVAMGTTHSLAIDRTIGSPPFALFSIAPTNRTGDTSTQFTFTDISSSFGGPVSGRSWDFGDGNSSTSAVPTHQFTRNGTYTVTLSVTDRAGLSDARTATVAVSRGPLYNLTATPSTTTQTAGSTSAVFYNASGTDQLGNDVEINATNDLTWTVSPSTGGTFIGASFSPSNVAGNYTITATNATTGRTANVTLTILPGSAASLTITTSATTQSANATSNVTYSAVAKDAFGNNVTIDSATDVDWAVSASDAGNFSQNVLAPSTKAGRYIVTAALRNLTTARDTVNFTMNTGPVNSIIPVPSAGFHVAGASGNITWNANASDAFGNAVTLNATTDVSWSISPTAGGTFSGNVLAAGTASGFYMVTATLNSNTSTNGSRTFPIQPGAIVAIVIDNGNLSQQATDGRTITYKVTGRDAFGNNASVPTANATWEIAVNGTTGSVGGSFNANVLAPSTITGRYTVTATYTLNTSIKANADFTLTPGALAVIYIQTPLNVTAAGATTSLTYNATGKDKLGNNVTLNAATDVTWSINNSAGGSFSTNVLNPGTIAGLYKTSASNGSVPEPAEAFLQIVAATPLRISITNGNITQTAGNTSIVTYMANVTDAFGNNIPLSSAKNVTWTVNASTGGSFAANDFAPTNTAGNYTIRASLDSDSNISATVRFDIGPAGPDKIVVTTGNRIQTAGNTSSITYGVSATDSFGNAVALDAANDVTWSISPSSGGTMGLNVLSPTNTSGRYNVTATLKSDASKNNSVGFKIRPASIVTLTVAGGNASALAGSTNVSLAVNATDRFGNRVEIDSATEVSWAVSPRAGGFFSNNLLVAGPVSGNYTVTATLLANTSVTASTNMTIRPSDPFYLKITNGPVTQRAGQTSQVTYNVTATDSRLNPVPMDSTTDVTWSLDSIRAGSFSSNVLNPSNAAGLYTVRVHLSSNSSRNASASLQIRPAAPNSFFIVNARTTESADNVTSLDYEATSTDAFGNPIQLDMAKDILWTLDSAAGGSFTRNTFNPTQAAGTYTITATLASDLSKNSTAVFVMAPGPLYKIAFTSAPGAINAGSTGSFVAVPRDAFGNDRTDALTWSTSGGTVVPSNSTAATFDPRGAAGAYAITVTTTGGVRNVTNVTVNPLGIEHLHIGCVDTVEAGNATVCGIVATHDIHHNKIGDPSLAWSSPSGRFSQANGGVTLFTPPATVGTYLITATGAGKTASAQVRVVSGPLSDFKLSCPANATAGVTASCTVRGASDAYGNVVTIAAVTWDAPGSTPDLQALDAGFVWTSPGTKAVTASAGGVSTTATVTVSPGPVASLVILNGALLLTAGNATPIPYATVAKDAFGNEVPLAASAIQWGVSDGAGNFTGAILQPGTKAGNYTITARLAQASGAVGATVRVQILPSSLARLVVDAPETVEANTTVTVNLTGFDEFGNEVKLAETSVTFQANPTMGAQTVPVAVGNLTLPATWTVVAPGTISRAGLSGGAEKSAGAGQDVAGSSALGGNVTGEAPTERGGLPWTVYGAIALGLLTALLVIVAWRRRRKKEEDR